MKDQNNFILEANQVFVCKDCKHETVNLKTMGIIGEIGWYCCPKCFGRTITKVTQNPLVFLDDLEREYYPPSSSYEYWDGTYFYNSSGDQLRDPIEYDVYSEGYTPFGDE